MKNAHRSIVFMTNLALVAVVTLTACGSRIPTVGPSPVGTMASATVTDQPTMTATTASTSLPNREVAMVAGEVISSDSFRSHVMLTRQKLIEQYQQYEHVAQMYGLDPATDPTFSGYLTQIEGMLADANGLGKGVMDDMVNAILIRREAENQGLSISSGELDRFIQDTFGYFPDGTPTPTITPTSLTYPTLDATSRALITLTPTPRPSPSFTPDAAASPTPNPPTATPFTQQAFEDRYQQAVQDYQKLGFSESDFRQLFADKLYQEKLFTLVTKDFPLTGEQTWARHILVADEATANTVRSELEKGGDWVALAKQYSSDPGSKDAGGDLGWFGPGVMVPEFEQAVFDLQVGQISQPVKSQFGYHIIQVLARQQRPLTATEDKAQADQFFSDWLADIRSKTEVTIDDIYLDYIPSVPTLQDALTK